MEKNQLRLHYGSKAIRQIVLDSTPKVSQKGWKLGEDEKGPYIEVEEL